MARKSPAKITFNVSGESIDERYVFTISEKLIKLMFLGTRKLMRT